MTGTFDDYFQLMAQVGVTAFTLMFAAIQFRWHGYWSTTRLGKLAAGTALYELLTLTLVSVAISIGFDPVWLLVSIIGAIIGQWATTEHVREYRKRRLAGWFPTPNDELQMRLTALPRISYSLLFISSISWSVGALRAASKLMYYSELILATTLAWFLFSGLTEVLITLSPNLLDPDTDYEIGSLWLPSGSHALLVRSSKRRTSSGDHSRRVSFPEQYNSSAKVDSGIIILPEIWGVTKVELDIAKRLASWGYTVAVPDYYNGKIPSISTVYKAAKVLDSGDDAYVRRAAQLAIESLDALKTWDKQLQSIDALGMSVGGSAVLRSLNAGNWQKTIALYPTKFLVNARNLAKNTLILIANAESRAGATIPNFSHPTLSAHSKICDSKSAWELAFPLSKVEPFPARHGFFSGKSSRFFYRRLLRRFWKTGFDRRRSDEAWQLIETFLQLS